MKYLLPFLLFLSAIGMNLTAQPNVVIFYADDFGWGDMRLHNTDPQYFRYTPHMDEMFTEGIELVNYMTHAVCSPSRAGLLTGMHYAEVTSGPEVGGELDNTIPNFAKDFQAAGYKTGAFGKWHNSKPNFPDGGNAANVNFDDVKVWSELHQVYTMDLTDNIFHNYKDWAWGDGVNSYGFDRWVGFYNGGSDHFNRWDNWHSEIDWWHDRNYVGDEVGYNTDLITHYANQFIEDNKNDPFVCYIPHEAVHTPIQLKLSDLQEFCYKLDTELGISGQWDFVRGVTSLSSGNRIDQVQELRFHDNEEFDLSELDPGKTQLHHLIFAAYCYTLDKAIGLTIQKVKDIGEFNNTIFVFSSDNGSTSAGINLPFQGKKHSLWEGGTHVPAGIWWPGTFDKNAAPYSPGDNKYEGLISYMDIYPTLMSMTQQTITGTNLDGIDCWSHLQNRTDCRPGELSDAVYMMWRDHGALRTNRWKLMYSESKNMVEVYDLDNDVDESDNLASSSPAVRDQLVDLYKNWITSNSYAPSYMALDSSDILFPDPAPEGEYLEVKATQTAANNSDSDVVLIRFNNTGDWSSKYLDAGDRIEYDIYVHPDSDHTKGCYFTPGSGWNPYYKATNGLNQDGQLLKDVNLPKGVWTRQVVGVGTMAPKSLTIAFLAFRSSNAGYYHYSFDNIVVRSKDGSIKHVIWKSSLDFRSNMSYRYKNKNYNSLSEAQLDSDIPFTQLELSSPLPQNTTVSFAAPEGDVTIDKGDSLYINVHAIDADGIHRVRLYKNEVEFGRSEGGAPYEWGLSHQDDPEIKNMQPGVYEIKAIATDNTGETGEAVFTVTVLDDGQSPPPTNLVQNGSFEFGASTPTSWSLGANTVGSTEDSISGSYSLKLSSSPGNNRQTIALVPNTDYVLSFWVNASGMTANNIHFDTEDKFDSATGPNGPGGNCQFNIDIGDADTWTRFEGTFNSGAETSVTIRTYGGDMQGVVYFDDIKLLPADSVSDPYEEWKTTNGVTDDMGDDDNDGISNLMEYALGGNPNIGDSAERPIVSESVDSFDFVFQRNEADLTYVVEKSTDMVSWLDYVTVSDVHGVVGSTATVSIPNSEMSNGMLFLRLKVSN